MCLDFVDLVPTFQELGGPFGNPSHPSSLSGMRPPILTRKAHHDTEKITWIEVALYKRFDFETVECKRSEVFHTKALTQRDSEIFNRELADRLPSEGVNSLNQIRPVLRFSPNFALELFERL
jgi:hypothetical protein